MTFPVFTGIPVLSIFLPENPFLRFTYKRGENWGWGAAGHFLFTFILLNRGVLDVETIYFVSIEQKKYNFLRKLPGMLVSKKDEVICLANK